MASSVMRPSLEREATRDKLAQALDHEIDEEIEKPAET